MLDGPGGSLELAPNEAGYSLKRGKGRAMGAWLAAAFTVSLAASQVGNVELNSARPVTAGRASDSFNFRLRPTPQFNSPSLVQDGMIAEEELAPNAHVGLGFASMLGRNIHSVLIERELVPTRNPGVTFVLKFPQ